MEPTKVFKIVREYGDRLISTTVMPNYGAAVYGPGVVTLPVIRNSRLFAFRIYADAIKFFNDNGGEEFRFQLWEAKGEDPIPLSERTWAIPHPAACHIDVITNLENFWGGVGKCVFKYVAPRGTVGCLSIQLTEHLL